ncbi:MAG: DNA protecting protein DprA [Candidatus Levybacteria bacterium RIFCSPLOWO2_02_FULL_37_10]|nr:MAG: DNA protecting protein DprA [Candidatus Levybacteria bacterium RIFCSPHIGHO2_01_FULL_37_33]OGH16297.1 MAG: DNA protecting protein DprA [Candidatus Levybacteria bacterium RIFCSPHIGHO2_02_FULL_37_11]OGH29245.1 MAG: DNA protecting protein DprA [Candidatus Levybacteria bacterium RIFCSPHIGHO2_12_FULL_37_12]OGH32528.1 MAG: DNA protecting protein DprA [Candidatus Levybacteria bacterium RIFCSPLOWO2_01_FULL_36_54]OGH43387.1 MAG: DNA protecting protein DprA [Candidatus Levybacteria bacterium RIFCS
MDERNYWLGFSVFSGIGPFKFKKILEDFGTAKKAWDSSDIKIKKNLGESLGIKFVDFRSQFSIENYLKSLKKENVWFLTFEDKHYPNLLSKIKNPPFVLYGRGIPFEKWNEEEINRTIAVVGTRKTTQYGREVTRILASQLSQAGFTIVSGLAIGVDAISHKTALENGNKTIAVLGCGVDCCNPSENLSLYKRIIEEGGAVISELPLSHPPTKGSFPARNRIIAGLSIGVLVTEGAEDSGSLITANYAFELGRKVFAVPGPITSSLSKGPFRLIQKGAKLVTTPQDIIDELGIKNHELRIGKIKTKIAVETKEEKKILEILENEALHFDEIVRKSQLDSSKIGSLLSIMEIKGLVKTTDGGFYNIVS